MVLADGGATTGWRPTSSAETSRTPAGIVGASPSTHTIVSMGVGSRSRAGRPRGAFAVTTTRIPQSRVMAADLRAGSFGSSGTYTPPAIMIPKTPMTEGTDLWR